jgi:hypothetical protein
MLREIARDWGTPPAEHELALPGDAPEGGDTHCAWRGVDVAAPAAHVFRWLCQLRVAPQREP